MILRSQFPQNVTTAPTIHGSRTLPMFKQLVKGTKQSFDLILIIRTRVNASYIVPQKHHEQLHLQVCVCI